MDLWKINKPVSSKKFWDEELKKQERERKRREAEIEERAMEKRKTQALARIEKRKAKRRE